MTAFAERHDPQDTALVRSLGQAGLGGLQTWPTLRFRLSVVASLCCFIGAGAL